MRPSSWSYPLREAIVARGTAHAVGWREGTHLQQDDGSRYIRRNRPNFYVGKFDVRCLKEGAMNPLMASHDGGLARPMHPYNVVSSEHRRRRDSERGDHVYIYD